MSHPAPPSEDVDKEKDDNTAGEREIEKEEQKESEEAPSSAEGEKAASVEGGAAKKRSESPDCETPEDDYYRERYNAYLYYCELRPVVPDADFEIADLKNLLAYVEPEIGDELDKLMLPGGMKNDEHFLPLKSLYLEYILSCGCDPEQADWYTEWEMTLALSELPLDTLQEIKDVVREELDKLSLSPSPPFELLEVGVRGDYRGSHLKRQAGDRFNYDLLEEGWENLPSTSTVDPLGRRYDDMPPTSSYDPSCHYVDPSRLGSSTIPFKKSRKDYEDIVDFDQPSSSGTSLAQQKKFAGEEKEGESGSDGVTESENETFKTEEN